MKRYQFKGFGTEVKVGDKFKKYVRYSKEGEAYGYMHECVITEEEIKTMETLGIVEEKKRVFDFTDAQQKRILNFSKMVNHQAAIEMAMQIAYDVHFKKNNNDPKPDDDVVFFDWKNEKYVHMKRSETEGMPVFDKESDLTEVIVALRRML